MIYMFQLVAFSPKSNENLFLGKEGIVSKQYEKSASYCHGNIGGTDSADDCDHSVRIDRQLQQRKYRKR